MKRLHKKCLKKILSCPHCGLKFALSVDTRQQRLNKVRHNLALKIIQFRNLTYCMHNKTSIKSFMILLFLLFLTMMILHITLPGKNNKENIS